MYMWVHVAQFTLLSLRIHLADTTGEYSVYTEFRDTEIMFHVSTLLPYTTSNKQQVRQFLTYISYIIFVRAFSDMCRSIYMYTWGLHRQQH